jgi:hypothetical protein
MLIKLDMANTFDELDTLLFLMFLGNLVFALSLSIGSLHVLAILGYLLSQWAPIKDSSEPTEALDKVVLCLLSCILSWLNLLAGY